MLVPTFGKGSVAGAGTSPPPFPRPQYIRYIPQGEICEASRSAERPSFSVGPRQSPTQKAGLRYQRKVEKFVLESSWAGRIDLSPWFSFRDGGPGLHYCQPDLVLFGSGYRVAVETKLVFHWDAWWQLFRIYKPVLEAEGLGEVRALCICQSFDPATVRPEPVNLIRSLEDVASGKFNVMVVR